MKLQLKFRDSALFHGFRFKSAIPRVFRDRGKSLALKVVIVLRADVSDASRCGGRLKLCLLSVQSC